MVLHNDKWAKKAKRAVERRKGKTVPKSDKGALENAPLKERLDMNRPAEETEDITDNTDIESQGEDESSFEFDSGDEGKPRVSKTEDTSLSQSADSAQPSGQPLSSWRNHTATVSPTIGSDKTADGAVHIKQDNAIPRIDKRFARRKLVDNSSRYEEPVLDPYLIAAEPEVAIDYNSLKSKQFTNPKEVELVPDERSSRKLPQPMDDTAHFQKMKQLQQKEEYARDMKRRFGQRAGFGGNLQQAPSAVELDDDDFFNTVEHSPNDTVSPTNIRLESGSTSTDRQIGKKNDHEPLEKFLDDLLKL